MNYLTAQLSMGLFALRRPKERRNQKAVLNEYTAGWSTYAKYLDQCKTLSDWLYLRGFEDEPRYSNQNGELKYGPYDSGAYYRAKILNAIRQHFPQAKSVTEFGAGPGRNLLFLKHEMPQLACYGYELCTPGVELSRKASAKFGLEVKYSQLDYVLSPKSDYVFPETDVAFTLFSLEQIPSGVDVALKNISQNAKMGTIHMEPVPENYPLNYRGIVGRLDHWKVDYLRGFDQTVKKSHMTLAERSILDTAHNPLMFPTLYVLKKNH